MSRYENIGTVRPAESRILSSYRWEIKNFRIADKNRGDYLISPTFSTIHSSTEYKWVLHLYPKGELESSEDCMSLFLKYIGQSNVQVNVTFSLLDSKYCKVNRRNFQRLFIKGSGPSGFTNFKEQNFVIDKKNEILVDDTISILCEIIHESNLVFEGNLPDYCRLKEFDEFEKLLEDESTADVIIRIDKNEIKVHKAIIMGRSSVFQAMFEHDMKEKAQNVVEITDIKYEVMKEVFRFMYTGKVNELEKMAGDLLLAADKYSIKGLRVLSEKHLIENLTVSNTIDYLRLADMCNSKHLKSKIIQFIIHNLIDFIKNSEFRLLPVDVVCDVIDAVIRR